MTRKGVLKRVLTSPGLWALLVCCVFVAVVYVTHGHDPLAFVLIGQRFAEGDAAGDVGYDGQFAYYIASDPFGAPAHLDDPPYRYQRVLYPFLARLLALGIPSLIPWMLIGINVVSISLGAHLTGRLLERGELNPLLALLLPLWIGQLFALRADLNEPLCFCLVVVALWFYTRKRYGLSAAALAAGALAKEAALLFLPGLVLAWLWRRRWRLALRYALVALLPYFTWQAVLYFWMGQWGFLGSSARFELLPFYGITFVEPFVLRLFLVVFFALPVAGLAVLAAYRAAREPGAVYGWLLLANCLFIVFLTRISAVDVLAFFRLMTGVIVAALLFCAAYRLRRLALALHVLWLPMFVFVVLIPGFLC